MSSHRVVVRSLFAAFALATVAASAWFPATANAEAEYRYCSRESYGRGAGVPVSTCGAGLEKDGALCYPNCGGGYDGVGPVCWQQCPAGYTDDGAFCRKDAVIIGQASYGRGAGTIPDQCPPGKTKLGALCYDYCASGWNSDGLACTQPCASGYRDDGLTCFRDAHIFAKDSSGCPWYNLCCASCPSGYTNDGCFCRRDAHAYTQPRYERAPSTANHCPAGKENQNGLCYTPCQSGYSAEGPVCWQYCPSGYIDDGVTCRLPEHIFAKHSYGRGAGTPLGCAANEELDGALCYPHCASGYDGVGPVCWEGCPSDYPSDCGIGCATTSGDCAAGTLSPLPGPGCTEPATAVACNGSPDLCERRFDQVTFAMTHNAHAVLGGGLGIGAAAATNQTGAVYQQLRDGIRGMMIDVGSHNGEVWLCHGGCGISRFVRLADYLTTLRRFLDANPSETLTLVIEHTDGVSVADVAAVFAATGMDSRAYVKPNCAAWPTLSQLAGRILVFSQDGSYGGVVQRLWSQGFDNPYSYDIGAGFELPRACQVGRGSQSGLFVLNHFITPPSSGLTGPYANGSRLLDHVDACEAALGKTPNFISVDYHSQGSFGGGSFADYVASINASPRIGRAWDQGCAPNDLAAGSPCSVDGDCSSNLCSAHLCVDSVCGDGQVQEGFEDCDDGNAASGDCCSGSCRFETNGSNCDDGDACTVDDQCDGAGLCSAGAPRDCDDGNVCTSDSCSGGCVHQAVGGSCDDGDVCTTGDHCAAGACTGGAAVDCDDGNLCTTELCGAEGCEYSDNALPCDDGDVCTTADTCAAGSCTGGPPLNCDDGNFCTTEHCGEAGCEYSNNTFACEDGDACTESDQCSDGLCRSGPPKNCDDGNQCTADSCAAGVCIATALADETACDDDGDSCTSDLCMDGVCEHRADEIVCGDGKTCGDESCDDGGLERGDGCSVECQLEVELSRDEQKCVGAVKKSGATLSKAQAKTIESCVRDAAAERNDSARECMAADDKGKLAKGERKTQQQYDRRCDAPPPFGLADVDRVNAAARDAMEELAVDLFGSDLGTAIFRRDENSAATKCQAEVLEAAQKLIPIEAKTFLECEKRGLAGKVQPQILSGADLERCTDAIVIDAKHRLWRATGKIADALDDECTTVSTQSAFPGLCADAEDFAGCVAECARCRACRMFNSMAEITADCDLADDGAANNSCR